MVTKQSTAIDQVLTLDAFLQKQISSAVTSMDADTCYDRMAHSMISLCSQCLALVVEVITSLPLTIQLMKFFLQTAFGDSTCFYGGQQLIPYRDAAKAMEVDQQCGCQSQSFWSISYGLMDMSPRLSERFLD